MSNQQAANKNAPAKQDDKNKSNDPWANHQPTTGQYIASGVITGLAVYGAYRLVKDTFFDD